MTISSLGASDPYAAAAALDRQWRSSANEVDAAPSAGITLASGPDVVVTLGKNAAPDSQATYDASGRMPGPAALDEPGANAPDSMAKATESGGDDDPSAGAPSGAGDWVDDAPVDDASAA